MDEYNIHTTRVRYHLLRRVAISSIDLLFECMIWSLKSNNFFLEDTPMADEMSKLSSASTSWWELGRSGTSARPARFNSSSMLKCSSPALSTDRPASDSTSLGFGRDQSAEARRGGRLEGERALALSQIHKCNSVHTTTRTTTKFAQLLCGLIIQ